MLTLQSHNQVVYQLSQLSYNVVTTLPQFAKPSSSKQTDGCLENENSVCSDSLQEALRNCPVGSRPSSRFPPIKSPYQKDEKYLKNIMDMNILDFKNAATYISSVPVCQLNRRIRDPWRISYCSSNSFENNKNEGYSKSSAQTLYTLQLLTNRRLPPGLLYDFTQFESQIQQRRGFRTERTSIKDKQRNASFMAKLTNLFQSGPDAKSAIKLTPGAEKLEIKIPNVDGKISMEAFQALQKVYNDGFEAGKASHRMKRIIFFLASFALAGGYLFYNTSFSQVSHIHRVDPRQVTATFADVKGVDQAKKELKSVVEFLKNPQKFHAIGARLPKGILLVGEPGTGKTLLAKAVAGEAGVPFFFASGSEFDEVLVGEGARRVRHLFNAAKMHAPCVIFLDELDSVGGARTSSKLHPYANQTINQLLTEMDGFSPNDGVVVLAATNRQSDLDEALLRPGRFDMEIKVSRPLKHDRTDLLQLYLDKVITRDVDMELLSKQTAGFTGASIESMINTAAINAAVENSEYITMDHLMDAIDRIIMGPIWDNKDKTLLKNVAYHEGGHTIVSYFTPNSPRLDKVTIQPRGQSVGYTKYLSEDHGPHTKAEFLAAIDGSLGGRAAEELIFGVDAADVGAISDLQKATVLAKAMVKNYGMCNSNLRFVDENKDKQLSNESMNLLDGEIDKILKDSMDRVRALLRKHKSDLDKVAEALLKYETLSADDLQGLLGPQVGYSQEKENKSRSLNA